MESPSCLHMRKPCRMVRSWFWRLPAWQGVTKVYQSQNCGNSRAHSFGSLHTPLASIHLNLEHIMIWMTLWPKEICDMCNICVIITRSQTWQRGTEVLAMFGRHIHHVPTKTSFWNHSLASVTYRSPTSQRSHNVVMTCYDLVYWFNPPLPKPWRRILLCTTSASHEFQVSTPTAKWAKLIYKQHHLPSTAWPMETSSTPSVSSSDESEECFPVKVPILWRSQKTYGPQAWKVPSHRKKWSTQW